MSFREWIGNTFYNDTQLLPIYGLTIIVSFAILAVAIWFHELGHQLYFKIKLKKDIRVRFVRNGWRPYWECGVKEDYNQLTKRQYHDVMLWGIFMGVIPILASGFIWFPFVLLVVPYTTGVWSDIKEMNKSVEPIVEDIDKEDAF